MDQENKILYGSLRNNLWIGIVGIFMGYVGIQEILARDHLFFAILFVFFGVFGMLCLIQIIVPNLATVILTKEGFITKTLFPYCNNILVKWDDIENFEIVYITTRLYRRKVVGFNYKKIYTKEKIGRPIAKAFVGAENIVMDVRHTSADELLALLEDWRKRNM